MSHDQASYLMAACRRPSRAPLCLPRRLIALHPSMTADPKDRHMVAAAVLAGAQHVITSVDGEIEEVGDAPEVVVGGEDGLAGFLDEGDVVEDSPALPRGVGS